MARELGTANEAQTIAATVRPLAFAELDFADGYVRAHSGLGTITWGGNEWYGVGEFGGVGEVEEGVDVAARGLSLALNGIPSTVLPKALEANYRGRSAKLYIGFLDDAGALVDDPYQAFGGRMDTMQIEDAGETGSITVQCENRLIDFKRCRVSRYTNEEQLARYPGDLGLSFIAGIADKTLRWGPSNSNTSSSSAASANATKVVITRW
jgi:hypothetical protein